MARIPIEKKLREKVDAGDIEAFDGNWLDEISSLIDSIPPKDNENQ